MSEKTEVGVLGATGTVGERLVRMLHDHPWFRLVEVAASERSAGQRLGDALSASELGDLPDEAASLTVRSLDDDFTAPLLLSALPAGAAVDVEKRLARAGRLVVSNASAHRPDPDVPLVVPEVNPDHLALLDVQRERWPGGIVTNPNCVVAGVALAMAPLERAFGIERAILTTFQAISGAGRPGPASGELTDNILPHIPGEEEKMGRECRKILGTLDDGRVVDAELALSATATRVPVLHGHTASVSLAFRTSASADEVADALRAFRGGVAGQGLPLAPEHPIEVLERADRPQPRIDRDRGRGMTVTVGRIRPCEVLDVKLVVLSHNLVRGAAGAALLNAELCRAREILIGPAPAAR